MLSDKIKEILAERLANRIEKVNTRILTKIVKSIDELGKLTPTNAQRVGNILKYGGDYQKLVKEIQKATNLNKKEIQQMLDEVAKKNYMSSKDYYTAKKLNFIPYEQNLELKQQVDLIKKITNDTFNNLSNTSAIGFTIKDANGLVKFKDLSNAYVDAIDEAVLSVTQGKETFDSTITRIIKELGESGLKTINYASGRAVRLDSATRMSVQGAIRDMQNQLQLEIGRQTNCDGIEVTVHTYPAQDHEQIQGHQFRLEEYQKMLDDLEFEDVNGKKYPVTPRHIGMWNCYHDILAINVGISKPLYTQKELDKIIKENQVKTKIDGKKYTKYECTQLQRKLETEIRKQKDIQIMGRETNKQDVVNESQNKINILTDKYKELSKKANLPTQTQRLQVSGYRKVKVTNTSNIDKFTIFNAKNNKELNEIGKKYFDFKSNDELEYYVTKTSKIKERIQNGDIQLKEQLDRIEPKIDELKQASPIDFVLYSAKDIHTNYEYDNHLLSATISEKVAKLHINKKIDKDVIRIYVEKGANIISTYNTKKKQFNLQGEIILPTDKKLERLNQYEYILRKRRKNK